MLWGGVSVGESRDEIERVIELMTPRLPSHKPRYIMGIGMPRDLLVGVRAGADMFDCVLPTRLSRHGSFFDQYGRVTSVSRGSFSADIDNPLVPGCECATCKSFSRAYLKHLFLRKEITVYYYLAVHNMYTLISLTRKMRQAIIQRRFVEFIQSHPGLSL